MLVLSPTCSAQSWGGFWIEELSGANSWASCVPSRASLGLWSLLGIREIVRLEISRIHWSVVVAESVIKIQTNPEWSSGARLDPLQCMLPSWGWDQEVHVTIERRRRKTLFTGNCLEMKSSRCLGVLMSSTSYSKMNPTLLIFTLVLCLLVF